MKKPARFNSNLLSYFAAGAIPLLFFVFVLLAKIPYSISRIFWSYSFPFFLLVLMLYFVSFRLPGMYSWLAGTCLTMLLLGLTLSFLWTSGYSNDKIVGGLLPFRDAFDYYSGAKLILSGNAITSINKGAAWRPLYPGFLAALLLITGQNLQWALAIQAGLAGISYYLSAHYLRDLLGASAAAIYMTLLFFFIQPLIGTAYTETLGLALGCLGLVLLWSAGKTQRMHHLVFGLVVLMLAVSERAGAFFIFPLLVLWAGWAFRGQKHFSFPYAAIALLTVVATYLIVNTIYGKLMVEPGGFSFGNFAYTIYGQVVGGAGYHRAFEELGVRNPALVLRAAERFFLAHPLSFFIGAAKAYRDFFLPQLGIFGFGSAWGDILLWVAGTFLLFFGLYESAKKFALPSFSLLIAAFIGIFISIPFLPPIDGGIRIYASTMPFFYALPAVGIAEIFSRKQDNETSTSLIRPTGVLSIFLAIPTVFVPILILYLTPKPIFAATPTCQFEQVPYATIVSAGSYIDLLSDHGTSCGALPEICLDDFQANRGSNDPSDEEVFNELISRANDSAIRIFPAEDMINGRPHFFVSPVSALNFPNNSAISGCATEVLIKGRPSIFAIQTINDSNSSLFGLP